MKNIFNIVVDEIMISIIIPVHNCEDYLNICLNSILRQTFINFEVICIDDSSTDSSPNILKYFHEKDSRINILENDETKGPEFCINKGLEKTSGKYVLFLNPIDWIDSNTLELLYLKSEEFNLDLLIYKSINYNNYEKNFEYEQNPAIKTLQNYENKIFNPSSSRFLLLNKISSLHWTKFYKKSFLDKNNIRFNGENLICENEAFTLDILLNAKRISFLNACLNNNRIIPDKHLTLNTNKILNPLPIADIMIKSCLNNKQTYEKHKKEILNYIFNIIVENYERIDETQEYEIFESVGKFSEKCFEEYNLKTDIIENVDKNILNKFEQETSSLDKKYAKYLSIDVGGTAIKYTILNKYMKPKIREKDSKNDEKEFFNLIDEIISPHLNQIKGIAISFPGIINVEKGIVHTGGVYSWIKDLPLKSILEIKYKKPVWIENDGKCAALAELWKGKLSTSQNGVIIGIGTGISGGIILNGKLYRGINGSAGEFSSIIDNFEDPNKANKFSQIGGYKSLIERYAKAKGIDSSAITGRDFFEKYHNNDEIAMNVLKDYVKIISAGIINIQSILNVEKFCIGGGISSQEVLINEIKEVVHDYYTNKMPKAQVEPLIEKCFFENASGCVGALYNFLTMENTI